jgi:ribosomal protein L11 methyltransferase
VELDIELGTADNLGKEKFDIIGEYQQKYSDFDIPTYVSVLEDGGKLLLSGLCFFDVDDILEVCTEKSETREEKIKRKNGFLCC